MTDKQIITKSQMIMRIAELSANLIAKEQECDELNKWLPIVTRLEEQFKSHEKAKGIDYKTYAEQVFIELDQLKAENEVLEKINKINQEKIKKLNEQLEEEFIAQQYGDMALFWKVEDYKQALTEIKEIAEYHNTNAYCNSKVDIRKILQKCEVLDV